MASFPITRRHNPVSENRFHAHLTPVGICGQSPFGTPLEEIPQFGLPGLGWLTQPAIRSRRIHVGPLGGSAFISIRTASYPTRPLLTLIPKIHSSIYQLTKPNMKSKNLPTSAILFGLAVIPFQLNHAAILVNDTWIDGDRTTQEAGTDADFDGDIESAWFGTVATLAASPGKLTGSVGAGSSSWTTYLTAEGSEATLVNPGDTLTVSWTFTLTGTNATNASQSFRLALVNSPGAARQIADGNPGSAAYGGYGMFMNMGQTLGHANPFQLMERTDPVTASALLSASGSWTARDDQESISTPGYADAISYTFMMSLSLTALSELSINVTMSGGALGGDGVLQASYLDATPSSLSFDTFSLRPSNAAGSATTIDTTAFSASLTSIPEPSTVTALGGLALFALLRRRRS